MCRPYAPWNRCSLRWPAFNMARRSSAGSSLPIPSEYGVDLIEEKGPLAFGEDFGTWRVWTPIAQHWERESVAPEPLESGSFRSPGPATGVPVSGVFSPRTRCACAAQSVTAHLELSAWGRRRIGPRNSGTHRAEWRAGLPACRRLGGDPVRTLPLSPGRHSCGHVG